MIAALLLAGLTAAAPMPRVGPVSPYKLPPVTEWKLPSGLRVALVSDRRLPLTTIALAMPSGTSAYGAEDAGLVDAMAELMTDGTSKRSSRQIAEAADEYGGEVSAGADEDSVIVRTHGLSEKLDEQLALLSEVTRAPSFPEAEVALRRANMLEELKAARAQPDFLAKVAFYGRLFAGHPYGVFAPTEASIARVTQERVREAHKRLVTPHQALLVVVGDADPKALRALVERNFGSWQGPPDLPDAPAMTAPARERRVYLVDRPGSAQVSLLLGNLAVREDNPEYFNLLVANQVLGGSFASRLVQDIRETKGYTYRIGSRLEHRLTAALFRVATPVRGEVLEPALKGIFEHLARLRKDPVSAEELSKAKSFLAGGFVRSLETQAGVAEAVLHLKLHRLPPDFYDTFVERVQAVSAEKVLAAARQFIRPDEMTLVAVGDAPKIEDVLLKFSDGPVTRLSVEGDEKGAGVNESPAP